MPDLRIQIRTYLDETSEPITPEEVYDRQFADGNVRPLTRIPDRNWIPTGVLVAATAAAVALLVVGIPLLVSRGDGSSPAGDTASSTTVVTTTTIGVQSAPTTVQQDTVEAASSFVPGLGTLTWQRINGDETTLPRGISSYLDGQYVAIDVEGQWTSTDAVTWTRTEGAFGDYRWLYAEGDWAIGVQVEEVVRNDLLRKEGDTWVPVDLPPVAGLPEVAGITWIERQTIPIESDGVLITNVTHFGQIAWGDVFGVFEIDCGEPAPCEMQPLGWWDNEAQVLRIENPSNGTALARADVVVVDDEVRFVDRQSGEVIHVVRGTADFPANKIAEKVKRDGVGLAVNGGYVSVDDGVTWSWVTFPWDPIGDLVAVPDGGFASFVFEYDWQLIPDDPIVAATVWTSTDGTTWTDVGPPQFAIEGAVIVLVQTMGDRLVATARTENDELTGLANSTTYASTNALDWYRFDLPFPPDFATYETTFGMVVTSMPLNRWMFWVSTDGGSEWHEVEGPPGSHELMEAESFYTAGGVAGDILYVALGSGQEGPRTLWVGTFVP
jgi:hypothetical protein